MVAKRDSTLPTTWRPSNEIDTRETERETDREKERQKERESDEQMKRGENKRDFYLHCGTLFL